MSLEEEKNCRKEAPEEPRREDSAIGLPTLYHPGYTLPPPYTTVYTPSSLL